VTCRGGLCPRSYESQDLRQDTGDAAQTAAPTRRGMSLPEVRGQPTLHAGPIRACPTSPTDIQNSSFLIHALFCGTKWQLLEEFCAISCYPVEIRSGNATQ
jgi:hypothetical protein